jgi:hypothetical protein
MSGPSGPGEMSEVAQILLAAGLGLVVGPFLGVPQWWVLRRYVGRAGWWVLANSLAWALGMPVVFFGVGHVEIGVGFLGVGVSVLSTLAIAGAVVGAVHGLFLVWLLWRPGVQGGA